MRNLDILRNLHGFQGPLDCVGCNKKVLVADVVKVDVPITVKQICMHVHMCVHIRLFTPPESALLGECCLFVASKPSSSVPLVASNKGRRRRRVAFLRRASDGLVV